MIDIEEIKHLLPQRYPFLMVDRVVSIDRGKSIKVIKNVSINEPYFNGHFPQEAVMPGVLMIEAMAQAAGILGLVSEGRTNEDGYLYLLCGLEKTRFRRKVVPGDQLELQAELVTRKRNLLKFQCEVRVEGELVAATELLVAEQKLHQEEAAK
jgi:3-hydroxyacyl-[acyl-carrier-protein] dehydratase